MNSSLEDRDSFSDWYRKDVTLTGFYSVCWRAQCTTIEVELNTSQSKNAGRFLMELSVYPLLAKGIMATK
jgi:hypothetical protein